MYSTAAGAGHGTFVVLYRPATKLVSYLRVGRMTIFFSSLQEGGEEKERCRLGLG